MDRPRPVRTTSRPNRQRPGRSPAARRRPGCSDQRSCGRCIPSRQSGPASPPGPRCAGGAGLARRRCSRTGTTASAAWSAVRNSAPPAPVGVQTPEIAAIQPVELHLVDTDDPGNGVVAAWAVGDLNRVDQPLTAICSAARWPRRQPAARSDVLATGHRASGAPPARPPGSEQVLQQAQVLAPGARREPAGIGRGTRPVARRSALVFLLVHSASPSHRRKHCRARAACCHAHHHTARSSAAQPWGRPDVGGPRACPCVARVARILRRALWTAGLQPHPGGRPLDRGLTARTLEGRPLTAGVSLASWGQALDRGRLARTGQARRPAPQALPYPPSPDTPCGSSSAARSHASPRLAYTAWRQRLDQLQHMIQ